MKMNHHHQSLWQMLYNGGSAGTVPTNLHIVTIVCLQLEHQVSYEYQKAIHF